MPKVILTQAQRDKEALDNWEAEFKGAVERHYKTEHTEAKVIAKRIGIPLSTYYHYTRNPRMIRAETLLRIMDAVRFEREEREKLFGYANSKEMAS